MSRPLNSVYDMDWKPRVLIEANAGTGKTYTIAGLYVRLLVEKNLSVDQILVMTFTKKATSELRERILKLLRNCVNVLEAGNLEINDSFLAEFRQSVSDKKEILSRLRNAIKDFDESRITTIHGFCQRVLNEEALVAGTPFEVEILQHDDFLEQAVQDYWRLTVHQYSNTPSGRYYLSKLMSLAKSPEELKKLLETLISKSYAGIRGEVMDDPVEYLERVIQVKDELKGMWESEHSTIKKELLESDLKGFTERNVSSRIAKLQSFFNQANFEIDTFDQFKYFTTSCHHDPENLKKNKDRVPTHIFFEKCETYHELVCEMDKIKTTLILRTRNDVIERRAKLVRNSGSYTYDDLLRNVQEALAKPGGERLAASIIRKYPYALVDEFQDTDPVQYDIFDRIYPKKGEKTGLFMIGDPKQAIYAFRGADVYTYFKARNHIQNEGRFTLEKNYRSSPNLVKAVNLLFEGDKHSFIDNEIRFIPSKPGNPDHGREFLIDGKPADRLAVTAKQGLETSKGSCKAFTFQQTVSEISRLLKMADEGRVTIDGRKLQAGDIAVLVYGNKDADDIKQKLKQVGIDSVTYSRQQVFETFEAHRLSLLMTAVIEPFRQTSVSNVLMTGFFGLDLAGLYEYQENESKRQGLIEELQLLYEIWNRDGFYPMFRSLLFRDERLVQLARLTDAERILTNLYQLADICSKAEKEGNLDPRALTTWFLRERNNPVSDDERTLLLESDQNLVKISTIHSSKGLQFPVVFCPALWESQNNNERLIEFHPEGENELVIHAGQAENENRRLALEKSRLESVAEEVRKAYVAITRARYYCGIFWACHKESHHSGLGALLIGRQKVKESVRQKFKIQNDSELNESLFLEAFREFAGSFPGGFVYSESESVPTVAKRVQWSETEKDKLVLKTYNGRSDLPVLNQLESFSSLSRPHSADAYQPDYDQVMDAYMHAFDRQTEPAAERDIFNFPKGSVAGTAIHKIFERDEFEFSKAKSMPHNLWIRDVLEENQISEKWEDVIQKMLKDVTGADIPGLDLARVKNSDLLREMEFHYKTALHSAAKLLEIIRNKADASLNGNNDGFMTGFIDLIVRQNGKYFILDYKSNHLGNELKDYTSEHLHNEILANDYDLQYHIYTVALVQYLKKRIENFDYETHFGGVAYLFVRGMRNGSSNGVWFHKPDIHVVRNLEKIFGVVV